MEVFAPHKTAEIRPRTYQQGGAGSENSSWDKGSPDKYHIGNVFTQQRYPEMPHSTRVPQKVGQSLNVPRNSVNEEQF